MPVDYTRYPDNWKAIREQVLDREDHKCKWCGVENYAIGYRDRIKGDFYTFDEVDMIANHGLYDYYELFGDPDDPSFKPIKIVLTVAHLGVPKYPGDPGDKHDKLDCRLNNLAALCQKCHLNFDIDEHIENRRKTRELKIADTGQLNFFQRLEQQP